VNERRLPDTALSFSRGHFSFALTLAQKELDKIVDKINNRPRKVLGYLTPYEVFLP
jgi:IS30 family transposase